jgi:hypothetical protein
MSARNSVPVDAMISFPECQPPSAEDHLRTQQQATSIAVFAAFGKGPVSIVREYGIGFSPSGVRPSALAARAIKTAVRELRKSWIGRRLSRHKIGSVRGEKTSTITVQVTI